MIVPFLCRRGRKTTCFYSKRNRVLLSHVDARGKQLNRTVRGNGHYPPVWMREENILITLLEELGITLLCRNESRATQLHSKRKWSLLSCVDVRGKQLNCTLTGNGYYSPVSQPEENVTFMSTNIL